MTELNLTNPVEHYRRHSVVTDPGPHAALLRSLPHDVGELIDIIGGLFAHYQRDVLEKGLPLESHRKPEVDARFARCILDHLLRHDARPLAEMRVFENRYIGTCRDAGILLCTILREHGIAARVRYAFAPLMWQPHRPLSDHILVEYWSDADQTWRYADARLNRQLCDTHGITVDRMNVPESEFITAAQAWLASQRQRKAAFDLSGFAFDAAHGVWKARNIFMYDLASLAGWEPLLWDAWGYMMHTRPYVRPRGWFQFRYLNQLAKLDPRDPREWRLLIETYRKRGQVRVTDNIRSFSSVNGHQVVQLATPRAA
ncbi:MAG TPA: transglutaminase domain-containing protein [Chloroflexota bacterium]|jgi:hypothetical protein